MLKKIFKRYQIPNIAPSCIVPAKSLDFSNSPVISGTEAARTLILLYPWFRQVNAGIRALQLKQEPDNEVFRREKPWQQILSSGFKEGRLIYVLNLGLEWPYTGFCGLRIGVERNRANAVLSILEWKNKREKETQIYLSVAWIVQKPWFCSWHLV